MIDIANVNVWNIKTLDVIARDILGEDISGVSVGDNSRIHLLNDNQSNRDKCNAIFSGSAQLTVSASTTSITEGDTDPVITCNDNSIAGDADVGYAVLIDGDIYATGTTNVVSGVATLNLVSPIAGVYDIFMYRRTGNYVSNSVQITVSEV